MNAEIEEWPDSADAIVEEIIAADWWREDDVRAYQVALWLARRDAARDTERETLLERATTAEKNRARLRATLDTTLALNTKLTSDTNRAEKERDGLQAERDRLQMENASLIGLAEAAEAERDEARTQRDALAALLGEIRNAAANSGTNAYRAWGRIFTALDKLRADGGSGHLAARDAEMKAAAWDEGFARGADHGGLGRHWDEEKPLNPYRAARYRQESTSVSPPAHPKCRPTTTEELWARSREEAHNDD